MLRLTLGRRDLGFAFACAVAMMTVGSLVLSFAFGSDVAGWRFWLMQALYTLAIGSSAFIYCAIAKVQPIAAIKLDVCPRFAHMGWAFAAITCLIFGMMPLNSMLMDGIEAMGLHRPSVNLPNDLAGLIVVAAVLPAFCEEVVFRGVVARSAAPMRNKAAAVALCGALFALFHANPAQTIHQFVLGCFLTLLALRSGSLWTSVIAHLFNNLLVVALNFTVLGQDEFWNVRTNTGMVLGLMFAGLVGFGLCVFGYIRTTRSQWTEQQDDVTPSQRTNSLAALLISAAVCLVLWISALFV